MSVFSRSIRLCFVVSVCVISAMTHAANPGGVTGATVWYQANTGVYTDGACTTLATTGQVIGCWQDQSGNNRHANSVSNSPLYTTGSINNYPVIVLDKPSTTINTGDSIVVTGTNVSDIVSAGGYTAFFVGDTNGNPASYTGGQEPMLFGDSTYPGSKWGFMSTNAVGRISMLTGDTGSNATTNTAFPGTANNNPGVYTVHYDGTTVTPFMNDTVSTTGTKTLSVTPGGVQFGSSSDQTTYNNDIAEIIVYNTALSVTDRQRIHSYLALKYSQTLSRTNVDAAYEEGDYVSSSGTVIWDGSQIPAGVDTNFHNDIIGIGQDDASGLLQTVATSASSNNDGVITLSSPSGMTTNEFLLIGNDSGTATFAATGAPSGGQILQRSWRIAETGDVGVVDIEIDVANTNFNIPATPIGTGYNLLVDSDGDNVYTDETVTYVMYDDGTNGDNVAGDSKYTVQLNVSDGQKFTLSTAMTSFSGTVYVDESVTPIAAGKTIRFLKNGTGAVSATTNGSGQFTIITASAPVSGDILTFHIDGAAEDGVLVVRYDGSTNTGLDIYQDRLISRALTSNLSNTNMDTAHDGDTDITSIYTNALTTTLTVANNKELYIWTGTTHAGGGPINIGSTTVGSGSLDINGTLSAGASTITIRGDLDIDNAGTLTHTGTMTFDGSTVDTYNQGNDPITSNVNITNSATNGVSVVTNPASMNNLTIGSPNRVFNLAGQNLTVGGVFSNNGILSLYGNESVSLTQDTNSGTWRYTGDGDGLADIYTIADFGATDYYTVNITSTDAGDTYQLANNYVGANIFNLTRGIVNVDSYTMSIGGIYAQIASNTTFNVGSGSVTVGGLFNFSCTSCSYNLNTGSLSITGNATMNGTFNGGTGNLNVEGDFSLTSVNGVFTAPVSMTVAGSFSRSNGTFSHNNGTVILDRSVAGNQTVTGTIVFYNLVRQDLVADGIQLTLSLANASDITVAGTLTLQGNATEDLVVRSPGTAFINSTSGLYSVSDVNVSAFSQITLYENGSVKYPELDPVSSVNGGNTQGWFSNGILGIVYSDAGITPIGAGKTVRLLVNGVNTGLSDVTDASGIFYITGQVYSPGDILTLYLDDQVENGAIVTIGNVVNEPLVGLNIYQNYLRITHDNAGPVTNAVLATAATGDTGTSLDDISSLYSVSGGSLTTGAGVGIYIKSGDSFVPGGSVDNNGDLINDGTFNMGSNTVSVAGNIVNAVSATVIAGTGTLITDGTGDQQITMNNDSLYHFHNTNTGGTVSMTGLVSIGGDFTNDVNSVVRLNNNVVHITGTFSNNGTMRVTGGEFFGTFVQDTDSGNWEYVGDADGSMDGYTIHDFGAIDYYDMTIAGTDSNDTFTQSTNVRVVRNMNQSSGVFSGTNALQIGGDISHTGGTFQHTQSVTLDSDTSHTLSGNLDFNDLTLVDTIDDTTDTVVTLESGSVHTIRGVLYLDGLDNNDRLRLVSDTVGVPATFDFAGSSTFQGDFLFITDAIALDNSGGISLPIQPADSVDGGNTTGWFAQGVDVEFSDATASSDDENNADNFPTLIVNGSLASASTVEVSMTGGTATDGGTDYSWSNPVVITIPAGNYDGTTATDIVITNPVLVQDLIVEGAETITLSLGNPGTDVQLGDANTDSSIASDHMYTITDDDALLMEFTTATTLGSESVLSPVITLTIGGAQILTDSSVEVVDDGVGSASGGGVDFSFALPVLISIPAGDYTAPTILDVSGLSIIDDSIVEALETITLSLQNPLGGILGDANGDTTVQNTAEVTITDNDTASVIVTESAGSTGITESGSTDTYDIMLSTIPSDTVSITLQADSQCTVSPAGPLLFNSLSSQTVTVTADDDVTAENTHSCTITHTASSTDIQYDGIMISDIVASITDNDIAGLDMTQQTLSVTESDPRTAGTTDTFSISMDTPPTDDVTVTMTVSNGYAVLSDDDQTEQSTIDIVFTPVTYADPQVITVTAVDDSIYNGRQRQAQIATTVSSLDLAYNGLVINDLDIDITDGADEDGDGSINTIEASNPMNSGDGNGDGIPDSDQSYVAGLPNSMTGQYTTMQVVGDCDVIAGAGIIDSGDLDSSDTDIQYPVGIIDFELGCDAPGQSGTVTLYYAQQYDTANWLYRKYNPVSQTYGDISALTTFGSTVVGSTAVTTVTFVVTDGDVATDHDGIADSSIHDPSGPAVSTATAPVPAVTRRGTATGFLLSAITVPVVTIPIVDAVVVPDAPTPAVTADPADSPQTVLDQISERVCQPYLRSYIKLGRANKKSEVLKLQTFLNTHQSESLPVDGVYTWDDYQAVRRFQSKYADRVLAPWGLSQPTGYWYKTSRYVANAILGCNESSVRLDNGVVVQ